MQLPGRSMSGSYGYRYGFNGMETMDEIYPDKNSYAADFRMLDSRIGRWWSPDPIVKPWESPYAGFANNPIYYVDPSGLDPEKNKKRVERNSGGRLPEVTVNGEQEQRGKGSIDNPLETNWTKTVFLTGTNQPECYNFPSCPDHGDKIHFEYGDGHVDRGSAATLSGAPAGTYVYHGGNEYADAGWLHENEFTYVNLDLIGGQVLPPRSKFLGFLFGPRSVDGYRAVDDNGYLTGDFVPITGYPPLPTRMGPLGTSARSSRILINSSKQLQTKFKHAVAFGIRGNYNPKLAAKFSEVLNQHINNPGIRVIEGTYRGTKQVTHYLNPKTGLNVMTTKSGEFISGWRLRPGQIENILKHGGL